MSADVDQVDLSTRIAALELQIANLSMQLSERSESTNSPVAMESFVGSEGASEVAKLRAFDVVAGEDRESEEGETVSGNWLVYLPAGSVKYGGRVPLVVQEQEGDFVDTGLNAETITIWGHIISGKDDNGESHLVIRFDEFESPTLEQGFTSYDFKVAEILEDNVSQITSGAAVFKEGGGGGGELTITGTDRVTVSGSEIVCVAKEGSDVEASFTKDANTGVITATLGVYWVNE